MSATGSGKSSPSIGAPLPWILDPRYIADIAFAGGLRGGGTAPLAALP
jgi:hypothetical protein